MLEQISLDVVYIGLRGSTRRPPFHKCICINLLHYSSFTSKWLIYIGRLDLKMLVTFRDLSQFHVNRGRQFHVIQCRTLWILSTPAGVDSETTFLEGYLWRSATLRYLRSFFLVGLEIPGLGIEQCWRSTVV